MMVLDGPLFEIFSRISIYWGLNIIVFFQHQVKTWKSVRLAGFLKVVLVVVYDLDHC